MKRSNSSTLKRVFKYLKKHWVLVALSMLFALTSVVGTLYIPIRVGNAIDLIIEAGKVDFDKGVISYVHCHLVCYFVVDIIHYPLNNGNTNSNDANFQKNR